MKSFERVLDEIDDIVATYQEGEYRGLNELHRRLSTNMYWLIKYQVDFNIEWNNEYYKHHSTVNAVKERHADKVVPELYMCRKIWEAAKNVSISIGYEVKAD